MTRDYTQSIVHLVTGNELLRIRKQLGLTQVALAGMLGVASNSVARWERNEMAMREPVARLVRLLAGTKDRPKGKRGRW